MNSTKKILSIDTTSRVIDVTLSSNGKYFSIERDVQLSEYEGVISLIESVLKKSRLTINQIDYFGVCTGPGSFTGIRIGLSVMKALAYSTGKPLVGFGSLDLLAYMAKEKFSGLLCIMQDAKRNNIYSAVYDNTKGFCRVSPYLLLEAQKLLKKIKVLEKKTKDLYPPSHKTTDLPVDECGNYASAGCRYIGKSKMNRRITLPSASKLSKRILTHITRQGHKGTTGKPVVFHFCGDIALHYKEDIERIFPKAKFLQHSDLRPKGQAIISLTRENIGKSCNSFQIMPFYMYPRDCQVRKPTK